MPKIGFRLISWERIDGFGSYFAYVLLLTIPSLELSRDFFRQFFSRVISLDLWVKMNSAQYLVN